MSDNRTTTIDTMRELKPEEVDQVSGGHDWAFYMDTATAIIGFALALRR